MPELFIADQADLFERLEPVIHILVDLILGEAVALLQLAFELLAATLDHIEIVVGEFAPLFLGLPFELLPVTFDPVPIHCPSPPALRWALNERAIQTFPERDKVDSGFATGPAFKVMEKSPRSCRQPSNPGSAFGRPDAADPPPGIAFVNFEETWFMYQ